MEKKAVLRGDDVLNQSVRFKSLFKNKLPRNYETRYTQQLNPHFVFFNPDAYLFVWNKKGFLFCSASYITPRLPK